MTDPAECQHPVALSAPNSIQPVAFALKRVHTPCLTLAAAWCDANDQRSHPPLLGMQGGITESCFCFCTFDYGSAVSAQQDDLAKHRQGLQNTARA
jgi:hypothetical protein